jgi:small subunit ribosomal protein S6
MHKYEVMFIIRPDTAEEEAEKLIAQMEGFVVTGGGKMEKIEKVGRRKLAYRIQRQREGLYVLFVFEGASNTVMELERRMKVTDSVMKFLTVRVDEELKRAAKFAKLRAAKPVRRPKPSIPAAPVAPAAAPEVAEAN